MTSLAHQAVTVLDFAPKRQRAEWPAERVALLRKLFDEGLSYALIAEKLGDGATDSAVGAKINRLGWTRSAWGTVNLRRPPAPRPEKVRKASSPPRTAFSGMALKVGGNRADAGLKQIASLNRPLPWEK